MKSEVWILNDGRAGNYSQSLGLAVELGLPYKVVEISYGFFAFLPNFILRSNLLSLSCKSRKKLQDFDYFPKIIIAAGRRLAPISLYLKEKSKNALKNIHIMNPNANFSGFDFVILPNHDNVKNLSENILLSHGALTKINDKMIDEECEKFREIFAKDKGKKIAVFVGGDTKNTKFGAESGQKMMEIIVDVAKNMQAKLYVLTSRRTSKVLIDGVGTFLKESGCDFEFFDFQKIGDKNPYLAIIGFADFFIVTCDSVSMISESCSTGKPVYVFDDEEISLKKHKNFLKGLLLENYVRLLEEGLEKLENFAPKKLNETKRIALIIKDKLKIN